MQIRLILTLVAFCLSWQGFSQLTFKVNTVPANTPITDNIHVAGSFQNWNPADQNSILTKNGNGTYQITINPPVGLVKYKFTRGSWDSVEGNATGGYLPDREYNYTGTPVTLELSILSWEDLGGGGGSNSTAAYNVFVLDTDFYIPQLDRNRRIWVYLPPDYNSANKYYPVLYMHDGQNVFDAATSFSGEWKVDESLNELFNQGDYGCIVVAIDNGEQYRLDEYAPWLNASYNAGGQGGDYVDFIVETLKPYMDANYRTLQGRDYTGIMGSSLGGLISQYAFIEHQDKFSKAGIFSPAYWFNPEIFTHSQNTAKAFSMKTYSIAGQPEGNGSVVNDVNQMNSILLNNGFTNQEVKKVIHPDGQHTEWYWAREFPEAYIWLFGGLDFTSASGQEAQKVRVYPNPADSVLYITNFSTLSKPTYKIFSLDGKLVRKGKINSDSIDIGSLPGGAYLLNIFSKKDLVLKDKIIVKK